MKNCAIIIVFAFQCRASAARTVLHSAVPSIHDAMKQKMQENIDLKNDRYDRMKVIAGNQSITDNNGASTEYMKMDYLAARHIKRELVCRDDVYQTPIKRIDSYPVYTTVYTTTDSSAKLFLGLVSLLGIPFVGSLVLSKLFLGAKVLSVTKAILLSLFYYFIFAPKGIGKLKKPPLLSRINAKVDPSVPPILALSEESDYTDVFKDPRVGVILAEKQQALNDVDNDYDIGEMFRIVPENEIKLNKNERGEQKTRR